jgi:hypothetical protein
MKKRLSLILFILLSGGVAAQNNNKLPANAETFIKNQFKQLFLTKQNEIFDVIWNNNNLRTSLFGPISQNQLNLVKDSKKAIFSNWVNTMDNKIYKFIKIE